MTDFQYRALSSSGETLQGFRSAADSATLAAELSEQNLILLNSRPIGRLGRALRMRSGASERDLRDFTMHMATSLSSGIPVIQSLRDLEEMFDGSRFKRVIATIREEISSGSHFADALSHHPHVFPEVFIALIEAGESSGNMDGAFGQLVDYLDWSGDLKNKVSSALFYPALLAGAAVGLFLLMVLYVIPRFMSVFRDLDYDLPALTLRVLAVGDFFQYWWPFILGGGALLVFVVKVARSYEEGRYAWDRVLISTPVLGGFVEKLALSRFVKNFSMLLGAGIDILKVLSLLEKVVGNTVLAREVGQIRSRVMTGETLAASLEQSERFPPLIKRLIAVGEKSGSLELTLMKAAEHIDKELPRNLKRVFTVMEVAVMVLLGALIVTAALAMLLPIFHIQGQILN